MHSYNTDTYVEHIHIKSFYDTHVTVLCPVHSWPTHSNLSFMTSFINKHRSQLGTIWLYGHCHSETLMGTKTISSNFKLRWYTLAIVMSFKRFCFYLLFFVFVFSCSTFRSAPLKWGFDDLYVDPIPALTLYLGPFWAAKCLRTLHRVPGRLIFLELHLCLPESSVSWAW